MCEGFTDTVGYSLFAIRYSLFAIRYSLFAFFVRSAGRLTGSFWPKAAAQAVK